MRRTAIARSARHSVLLLLAVALAACAPTASDATAETSPVTAPTVATPTKAAALTIPAGFDGWELNVSGAIVEYRLVEQVTDPDGELDSDLTAGITHGDGGCVVELRSDLFGPDEQIQTQVQIIAMFAALCANSVVLDNSANGFNTGFEYAMAWHELYVERCGLIGQPLGWPVEDGSCELPAATDPTPS